MKKMTIKYWAVDDRPREKLITKGPSSLSAAELIAILIGSGNKQESAVDLSKRILMSVDNNIHQLSTLTAEKLTSFKGIGMAKAIAIITALELGKRRQLANFAVNPKITGSKDVYDIMQPLLGSLPHEEFWVLYLNNANKVLSKTQLSKGGITATLVDVRLLFKKAVEISAVAIIICHNHPSGKTEPSSQDKVLTKKIKEAGVSLDIKLLDHLIITEKSYFSFADNGKI
jgi:DNA repair protein RadC